MNAYVQGRWRGVGQDDSKALTMEGGPQGGNVFSTEGDTMTISTSGDPTECDLPRGTQNAIYTEGDRHRDL